MKQSGNEKIGIVGASTTATLALTAASYFHDITWTLALTPSDFIWQGFMQGNKDGCKKWPIKGESLFSYKGQPLPYMPFVYQHLEYWQKIEEAARHSGNMIASRFLFEDSEKAFPLKEEQMIPIENIKGHLIMIGAQDDVLWDTVKYINRMKKRLETHLHDSE